MNSLKQVIVISKSLNFTNVSINLFDCILHSLRFLNSEMVIYIVLQCYGNNVISKYCHINVQITYIEHDIDTIHNIDDFVQYRYQLKTLNQTCQFCPTW